MLYIIATPIGNLADITFRAIDILSKADMIACEDTRHSKILLDHYKISKPLISFHQYSKIQKINDIIAFLKQGKEVALICDAGTPGISDPAFLLVQKAVEEGIAVSSIPGPSAVAAAASIAGLPMERFTFLGFLPRKKGKQTVMKQIAESELPSVFYESTHRILKTLEQMKDFIAPERKIIVCRELTKKFESIYRGTVSEVLNELQKDAHNVKGEFVVVVDKSA